MSTDMPGPHRPRWGTLAYLRNGQLILVVGQTCPMNGGGGVLESSTCVFLVGQVCPRGTALGSSLGRSGTLPHQLPTWVLSGNQGTASEPIISRKALTLALGNWPDRE
jgi:hypothetical protein